MRLFHRFGWAVSLVFFGATAGAQEAPRAQPAAAASAQPPTGVAATVNGEPIMEVGVQRGLKRLPADKQAEARIEILIGTVGFEHRRRNSQELVGASPQSAEKISDRPPIAILRRLEEIPGFRGGI